MNKANIPNADNGFSYVLRFLFKTGYRGEIIRKINENRYAIVQGRDNNPNIAITYKKEKLRELRRLSNKKFEHGYGDCLNIEDIKKFVQCGVTELYIIFKNGELYSCYLNEIIGISYERVNGLDKKITRIFPLSLCTLTDTTQAKIDIQKINNIEYYEKWKPEKIKYKKIEYQKINNFDSKKIEEVWNINSELQKKVRKLKKQNKVLKSKFGL